LPGTTVPAADIGRPTPCDSHRPSLASREVASAGRDRRRDIRKKSLAPKELREVWKASLGRFRQRALSETVCPAPAIQRHADAGQVPLRNRCTPTNQRTRSCDHSVHGSAGGSEAAMLMWWPAPPSMLRVFRYLWAGRPVDELEVSGSGRISCLAPQSAAPAP
jgi:hypothetical protein